MKLLNATKCSIRTVRTKSPFQCNPAILSTYARDPLLRWLAMPIRKMFLSLLVFGLVIMNGLEPLKAIAPDDAPLHEVARIGYGRIMRSEWNPDGSRLLIISSTAARLYSSDMQELALIAEGDNLSNSMSTGDSSGRYVTYITQDQKQVVVW